MDLRGIVRSRYGIGGGFSVKSVLSRARHDFGPGIARRPEGGVSLRILLIALRGVSAPIIALFRADVEQSANDVKISWAVTNAVLGTYIVLEFFDDGQNQPRLTEGGMKPMGSTIDIGVTRGRYRLTATGPTGLVDSKEVTATTPAAQEAMEWQVPPPPQPLPGDPAPGPAAGAPLNRPTRSGLLSLTAASPADVPSSGSGAAIAAAWTGACAGGDRYSNNCAHFLSNALIGGGYSELLDYGARCSRAQRPLRARELNQWFIAMSSTMPAGITSRQLQHGTGWWVVFQLNETVYWGGHVALLDADNWVYYGTGWYGNWDQYLYAW